ncbi:MAG: hypothetical protein OEV85_09580 [Candidatus Thorarchaeota archaeon]|nr:hypothetical protein [Candidatus Thorarchaeota archaeon]
MKLTASFLMILLLSMCMFSASVTASTNQGFEWGFETGDEFQFVLHALGDGLMIDEEIYIEANASTPIPDSITNWTDIPVATLDAYYANGTEMGIEVLLLIAAYNIELPIGNWTYLNYLAFYTLGLENFTFDDYDEYFWGYSWEDDNWTISGEGWTLFSKYSIAVHVDYLKVDGFISHYSVITTNRTTQVKTGEITLERLGIEQYTDRTNPILNQPEDIEYVFGDIGYNITWVASDDHPVSYQIQKDGTEVLSGDWNTTTEEFTIEVDNLEVGEYAYHITVVDIGGNAAYDDVYVIVLEPHNALFDNPLLIVLIVGLIAGAAVAAIIVTKIVRKR